MKSEYGARVERGTIQTATGGSYTVASLDRKGIVTPPITSAGSTVYAVGDTVCFILFSDGTGKILCGM